MPSHWRCPPNITTKADNHDHRRVGGPDATGINVMPKRAELAADLGYLPLAQVATFIRDRPG